MIVRVCGEVVRRGKAPDRTIVTRCGRVEQRFVGRRDAGRYERRLFVVRRDASRYEKQRGCSIRCEV
jgi:hypothetical protein